MSLVGDVFGAGKGFEFFSKVLDKIFPDKGQSEAAKLRLAEMAHNGELQELAAETGLAQGQLDINKIEASSPELFVAGWRPYIGWVCGAGLSWEYVLQPIATWGLAVSGNTTPLPDVHAADLIPLLFVLLGVGTWRTVEKIKGVAR